jgi:membrane-bound lytic murein transglycosylase B
MRFVLSLLLLCPLAAAAAELPGIPRFIDEMVAKHQFRRDELVNVFSHAQHRPAIIESISRPFTVKPWLEYRAAFVNKKRIRLGLEFQEKYRLTLRRAEKKYGVPQEIVVALIGVETIYGENMGNYRVLDALTTLAFDYPRRADFFRGELEHFLLLARDQQFDLLDMKGSYAGAMGIPQFMPGSFRKYAVDFNGNGKIDLRREARDAIGSVANYLQGYGWIEGAPIAARVQVNGEIANGPVRRTLAEWAAAGVVPEGNYLPETTARLLDFTVDGGKEYWLAFTNFDVITLYNNSDFYAMTVLQLAEELKKARKSSRQN